VWSIAARVVLLYWLDDEKPSPTTTKILSAGIATASPAFRMRVIDVAVRDVAPRHECSILEYGAGVYGIEEMKQCLPVPETTAEVLPSKCLPIPVAPRSRVDRRWRDSNNAD
jgi:hypothetical protein